MRERENRPEKISPSFRRLQEYVATGYSIRDVRENFPTIDGLWGKLNEAEQQQYRQLLVKRKRELTSILESGNAIKKDRADCEIAIQVVELVKDRIDALSPPRHDTWHEKPTQ